MTTLNNNVLSLGASPDTLFIAVQNTVFPKRMAKTWNRLSDDRRIEGTIGRLLAVPANASELWHWWPWDLRGWPSSSDAKLATQLIESWRSFDVYIADLALVERAMQEMRGRIVDAAKKKIGSALWPFGVANGVYPVNSNKCSLFVHDVTAEAGADTGLTRGFRHPSPPAARDWATASKAIPSWRVLRNTETAAAGDVVAQDGNYSDATGHVMTVGPPQANGSLTFIGTSDAPGVNPPGAVVQIPAKANIVDAGAVRGPEVFRRWDPLI